MLVDVVEHRQKPEWVLLRVRSVVRLLPVDRCDYCRREALQSALAGLSEGVFSESDGKGVIVSAADSFGSKERTDQVIERTSEVVEDLASQEADLNGGLSELSELEGQLSAFGIHISEDGIRIGEIVKDDRFQIRQLFLDSS
ncbi:MAG: hypothetical protein ACO1SV_06570 [Fimbriimonas sp.]